MTVDNIADRLLKLDEKSRSDIFNDFSIKLESNEISRTELSEKIINKFDKNKQLLEKLELNIVYFELFPELNSIPKDVLKNFFPRRLRNKITSKMSKNEVLQFLKESMVNKSIDVQKVNKKFQFLGKYQKTNLHIERNHNVRQYHGHYLIFLELLNVLIYLASYNMANLMKNTNIKIDKQFQ